MVDENDQCHAVIEARLADAHRLVAQVAPILEEDRLRRGKTDSDRDAKGAERRRRRLDRFSAGDTAGRAARARPDHLTDWPRFLGDTPLTIHAG